MNWQIIKSKWVGGVIALFLIFLGLGFWLLFSSHSDGLLTSPWQVIHPTYIYVFFGVTILLGFLILYSRLASKVLLGLIILYSFLLHAYLPATHTLMYGADQWRHSANEEQIKQGQWPQKVVLSQISVSSDATNTQSVVSSKVEVGDFAYSGFWVLSAGISKITGLDLVVINKWFVPIVWSIVFPILLLFMGRALGWSDKTSFVAVWAASLPFALQAGGSFTLPVNLGFLVWLGGVLMILRRLKESNNHQLLWLGLFGLLSVFNYTLFFILFWLVWGVAEIIILVSKKSTVNAGYMIVLSLVLATALPVLELVAGYSWFDSQISFFAQLKQMIGNFLGVYIASGPRPHDIATGNIIFNQVPSYAFVQNVFTAWRWWIPVFMFGFWSVFKFGLWTSFKSKSREFVWIAVVTYAVFVSYVVSRYFLSGEQILTRRLDVVLALCAIVMFVVGVREVVLRYGERGGRYVRLIASVLVVLFSGAIAASYTLGPDTQTVSLAQYRAMQYIWDQEKENERPCVIAGTYPLLALEAISKKTIVGGGFPINKDFGQPELQKFRGTIKATTFYQLEVGYLPLLKEALEVTGAATCWYVPDHGDVVEVDRQLKIHWHGIISFDDTWGESYF